MPKPMDLTNQKFGRLTVIDQDSSKKRRRIHWVCRCSCGNIITVRGSNLKCGQTKSCGCLQRDVTSTHGMDNTPEYRTWIRMKSRCYSPNDPSFKRYGGRGITVCAEWMHDFMCFFKHVGKRPSTAHSIERTDNDSSYKPGNVKWASATEQANNRANNKFICLYGWNLTVGQWAKFVGLRQATIAYRIRAGWPVGKAIFKKSSRRYHTNLLT